MKELLHDLKKAITTPFSPIATWTNLAYILAGLYLMVTHPIAWFYGVTLCMLGLASALYHGTGYRKWRYFDRIGMYSTFSTLLFFVLYQLIPLPEYLFLSLSITLSIIFARNHKKFNTGTVIPLMFLITWLILITFTPHKIYYLGILLLFAAAGALNMLGEHYNRSDNRNNYLKHDLLHGTWHLLTALGLVLLVTKLL